MHMHVRTIQSINIERSCSSDQNDKSQESQVIEPNDEHDPILLTVPNGLLLEMTVKCSQKVKVPTTIQASIPTSCLVILRLNRSLPPRPILECAANGTPSDSPSSLGWR